VTGYKKEKEKQLKVHKVRKVYKVLMRTEDGKRRKGDGKQKITNNPIGITRFAPIP